MVVKRRILLYEAYETDEENFVPYTPNQGELEEEDETTEEEATDDEDEEEEETTEENDDGYILHQGEILKKFYYGDIHSSDVTYDYKDIKNSGNLSLVYSDANLKQLYLGIRCRLSTEWLERVDESFDIKKMPQALLGFITGSEFSDDTHKLTLDGMDKLMDKKYEFNFTQMKISEIMAEVIKTAGLVPKINFDGLEDQVIDFSTVTKSDSDDEGSADYGDLPAEMCNAAKKMTKSIKSKRGKAEAIYKYIDSHCPYIYYPNTRYGRDTMWERSKQNQGGNCCDHAHLSVGMLRCIGIKANYVHGPNHVWAVAYVPDRVMFDPLGYQNRPMGQVWSGLTGTEMESIGF